MQARLDELRAYPRGQPVSGALSVTMQAMYREILDTEK